MAISKVQNSFLLREGKIQRNAADNFVDKPQMKPAGKIIHKLFTTAKTPWNQVDINNIKQYM